MHDPPFLWAVSRNCPYGKRRPSARFSLKPRLQSFRQPSEEPLLRSDSLSRRCDGQCLWGLLELVMSNFFLLRFRCSDCAMWNIHLPHDCCYCTLIFKCTINRKLFVQLLTFVFLLVHEYLVFLIWKSCFGPSWRSCVKYHQILVLSICYCKAKT